MQSIVVFAVAARDFYLVCKLAVHGRVCSAQNADSALPECCTDFFAAGEGGMSNEEKAKMVLDELQEKLPELYIMDEIRGKVDEVTPYVMVAIQVRGGCHKAAY
jgi:hypothetical protein